MMFEVELHHYGLPMEVNCHPEVDETPLLPELMIPKHLCTGHHDYGKSDI